MAIGRAGQWCAEAGMCRSVTGGPGTVTGCKTRVHSRDLAGAEGGVQGASVPLGAGEVVQDQLDQTASVRAMVSQLGVPNTATCQKCHMPVTCKMYMHMQNVHASATTLGPALTPCWGR